MIPIENVEEDDNIGAAKFNEVIDGLNAARKLDGTQGLVRWLVADDNTFLDLSQLGAKQTFLGIVDGNLVYADIYCGAIRPATPDEPGGG